MAHGRRSMDSGGVSDHEQSGKAMNDMPSAMSHQP
jgi:hypothetical protein